MFSLEESYHHFIPYHVSRQTQGISQSEVRSYFNFESKRKKSIPRLNQNIFIITKYEIGFKMIPSQWHNKVYVKREIQHVNYIQMTVYIEAKLCIWFKIIKINR